MGQEVYVIHYNSLPDVERASKRTMATYIETERATWSDFLEELIANSERVSFSIQQSGRTGGTLAKAFDQLEGALEDSTQFSTVSTRNYRRGNAIPPPSDSVEGRLILGLHRTGRIDDALAAYTRFAASEFSHLNALRFPDDAGLALYNRGEILIAAAHAASVVTTKKDVGGSLREAQSRAADMLKALDASVGEADQTNIDHVARLSALRDHFTRKARRLRALVVGSERQRGMEYRRWRSDIEGQVESRFAAAGARMDALDKVVGRKHEEREKQFQALKDLFHVQLRLRAPVALWEKRSETHRDEAKKALVKFWAAAFVAVLLGLGVPACAGDYIADSFSKFSCLPGQPQNCTRIFSAKGPLTVAGILLMTSLILWVTRMQYRIFLSERHLSLDADEKRAFAETFMALKEDTSVDVSNETIVLTSLFRPTQDGIIKDGDGGFDLSAAALLAKSLSK